MGNIRIYIWALDMHPYLNLIMSTECPKYNIFGWKLFRNFCFVSAQWARDQDSARNPVCEPKRRRDSKTSTKVPPMGEVFGYPPTLKLKVKN